MANEVDEIGRIYRIRPKQSNPIGKIIGFGLLGLMLLGALADGKKPTNTSTAISSQYSR